MKIGNCGESSAEQQCRLRKRLWCARTIENPEQKLLTRPASLEMCKVEMSAFMGGRGAYGNVANRVEVALRWYSSACGGPFSQFDVL